MHLIISIIIIYYNRDLVWLTLMQCQRNKQELKLCIITFMFKPQLDQIMLLLHEQNRHSPSWQQTLKLICLQASHPHTFYCNSPKCAITQVESVAVLSDSRLIA